MFSALCGNSIDASAIIRERERENGSSELLPTDAPVKPQIFIPRGSKEAAVKAGLVPSAYIDCDFDLEKIKQNQIEQNKKSARKFIVRQFDKYSEVTHGILSTIALRKIPNQSYILGAPNGFGKTSFVNKWAKNTFTNSSQTTIGSEYGYKVFEHNGTIYNIQLWDIAGQDKNIMVTKYFARD